MKTIGLYLFLFGIGSIILNFLGREFVILSWIDTWGLTVGWVIRAAMVAIGGVMWLVGRKRTEPATA